MRKVAVAWGATTGIFLRQVPVQAPLFVRPEAVWLITAKPGCCSAIKSSAASLRYSRLDQQEDPLYSGMRLWLQQPIVNQAGIPWKIPVQKVVGTSRLYKRSGYLLMMPGNAFARKVGQSTNAGRETVP